jgi:hypothetical protein
MWLHPIDPSKWDVGEVIVYYTHWRIDSEVQYSHTTHHITYQVSNIHRKLFQNVYIYIYIYSMFTVRQWVWVSRYPIIYISEQSGWSESSGTSLLLFRIVYFYQRLLDSSWQLYDDDYDCYQINVYSLRGAYFTILLKFSILQDLPLVCEKHICPYSDCVDLWDCFKHLMVLFYKCY